MGDEVEDILESFRLSDDKQKLYKTVRGKYDSYFVKKGNILFDQISFFKEDKKRESQWHLWSMTYMSWPHIVTLVLYTMKWSEIYW